MPTWHGHPTLGSLEPSQPLGWEDTCPKEAEAEKTSIAEAIGYEEDQGTNTARPSEQSVTFWCRYWSRDRSRDHFGLKNGLETSLVTLGSVTFWSQNCLETSLRPFGLENGLEIRSRHSVLSTQIEKRFCALIV